MYKYRASVRARVKEYRSLVRRLKNALPAPVTPIHPQQRTMHMVGATAHHLHLAGSVYQVYR